MNRYQIEVAELDRRHRLTTRVATLIGAAAIVVAALWSAGLPPSELLARAVHWFDNTERVPAPPASPPPTMVKSPAPALPSTSIASSSAGTDTSISPTALPLYLLATVPGRNAREGTALLGTSLDNPQTYSAGALLVNGTRLAEIHVDHVLLRNGSREAKLFIYRRSAPMPSVAGLQDLTTVGGAAELKQADPPKRQLLTDYVRPSPVYDGEILKGYRVYPGQKSSVFYALGLQAGDVIVAIDDAAFADPAQAIEALQQIVAGVAVVATVERSSAVQRITLDGALIAEDIERSRAVASL